MVDSNYGLRLTEWRKRQKISQRALSDRLEVSRGYISDIEAGRSEPSRNFLKKLTETFNVSADWVLYGVGEDVRRDDPAQDNSVRRVVGQKLAVGQNGFTLIPRMELCVSAGSGVVSVDDEYAGALAFSDTWIKRNNINAQLSVLVSVKGDSMAPTIPDGALVLVHLPEKRVEREGVYAFNRADCSFIKRLVPSSPDKSGRPGSLAIISNNPAYPPEVVTGTDMNEIHIVGRVRCVMTTL